MTVVTVRIAIDLNVRGGNSAPLTAADGLVSVGDEVLAVEPFDGIVADATVVDLDDEQGMVYLAVDWGTLRDDPAAQDDPGCE